MTPLIALALFLPLGATAQPEDFSLLPPGLEQPADSNTGGQTVSTSSPYATTLEFGVGFRSMDYREELEAPLKSTENGTLREFMVHFRSPVSAHPALYTQFGGTLGMGNTVYDGSLHDGTPHSMTTRNVVLDLNALAGVHMRLDSERSVQLFLGVSTRSWVRDMNADPSGYLETYRMYFIPVGAQYNQTVTSTLSVHPEIVLTPLVTGQVTAFLSKFGSSDVDLPLGRRLGARVSVPLRLLSPLGSHKTVVSLAPFIEYTGIGAGHPRTLTLGGSAMEVYEPASTNTQYGLQLRLHTVL